MKPFLKKILSCIQINLVGNIGNSINNLVNHYSVSNVTLMKHVKYLVCFPKVGIPRINKTTGLMSLTFPWETLEKLLTNLQVALTLQSLTWFFCKHNSIVICGCLNRTFFIIIIIIWNLTEICNSLSLTAVTSHRNSVSRA